MNIASSPVFLWPIPCHDADDGANNARLEFRLKEGTGTNPTYYGTDEDGITPMYSVGEPTPHGFPIIATSRRQPLLHPMGYDAWSTIYDYAESMADAMREVGQRPTGFQVDWSIGADGKLLLSVSANDWVELAFEWTSTITLGRSHDVVAALWGFNADDAAYRAVHHGIRPHAHGFHAAADSTCALARGGDGECRDLHVVEHVTLTGAVVGAAWGGVRARRFGFDFLSADQVNRLEELWSYARSGAPVALWPEGMPWTEAPLAWLLSAESRRAFRPRQMVPGLPRFALDLDFVLRN